MVAIDSVLATALGGVVLGSLYALMAMGLTLIYSTVRILNFSHGGFYMWGAMLVWWLSAPAQSLSPLSGIFLLPLNIAIVIGIGAFFVVGVGVQRGINGPLLKRRGWDMNTMVALFALAVILESSALLTLGPGTKGFAPIAEGFLRSGNLRFGYASLIQFIVSVGALIALQFFLKKSRHGLAMRAVAQDREAASVCSVKISNVYLLVFGLGATLAAISGILLSNLILIDPSVGWFALIRAFIIIVFGGIGSVPGTIIAAFLFAYIEQYTALFIGISWSLIVAFIAMIIVLIFKPQGLFGLKE